MGGLLQQFGLGLRGVNRVANPVDLKDGELRLAQNAALSTKHGRAALLKRLGFGMLVDTSLSSGSILAIAPLPFADPDPGTIVYGGYPPWPILPAAPVSGASTASSSAITVNWAPVLGATGYSVRVATDAGMTNVVSDQDVGNVTTADVTGLNPDTQYYWDAQAYNERGDGPTSDPEPEHTEEAPPPTSGEFVIEPISDLSGTIPASGSLNGTSGYPATISLDGAAPVLVSSLDPGFQIFAVSIHRAWFWSAQVPGRTCDCRVSINGVSKIWDPYTSLDFGDGPGDNYAAWGGTPTLADLAAATLAIDTNGWDNGGGLAAIDYGLWTGLKPGFIYGGWQIV